MQTVTTDIAVAGGGFTGVAAALAAARQGARVILMEQSGCLGGAASNNLVNPFMRYWTEKDGKKTILCGGIFAEIVQRLKEMNAMEPPLRFHEEYLKVLLDRMLAEEGVQVLFHVALAKTILEQQKITQVMLTCKSGSISVAADQFIDATGDGDLAYLSNCPFFLGRDSDGLCQPMTLCFRVGNVDMKKYEENKEKINLLYQKYQQEGKIKNPRENVLVFHYPAKGVLHFNTTRIVGLNPTDPFQISQAERMAREQVMEMMEFLQTEIPGFENSCLLATAPAIGVRESRRIDGEYLLTQEDLKNCTKFEDAIAAGNYDIDIHNPAGTGTSHYYFAPGTWYTIPYRSLQPKNIRNLLVGGRCLSATHEAQASIRIMPICCCTGQAAGTASAMAWATKTEVKNLNVKQLQQQLKQDGAFF